MSTKSPTNQGIVLYAKGTPGGATYVDRKGTTQNVVTLDTSFVDGAEVALGRSTRCATFAVVHFHGGDTRVIRLQLVVQPSDPDNDILTASDFGTLMLDRQDGNGDVGPYVDVDPADGADQRIVILTEGTTFFDAAKWQAKAVGGAPNAGTYVILWTSAG